MALLRQCEDLQVVPWQTWLGSTASAGGIEALIELLCALRLGRDRPERHRDRCDRRTVSDTSRRRGEAASKFLEMPQAAIRFGRADVILPPSRIADALNVVVDMHGRSLSHMSGVRVRSSRLCCRRPHRVAPDQCRSPQPRYVRAIRTRERGGDYARDAPGILAFGAIAAGSAVHFLQITLREQIIGTWRFVSNDNVSSTGKKRQLLGANPQGMTIYHANGWYVQLQINPDHPKFKGATRLDGTADENKAVVAGTAGHLGTWSVMKRIRRGLRIRSSTCSRTTMVRNPHVRSHWPATL